MSDSNVTFQDKPSSSPSYAGRWLIAIAIAVFCLSFVVKGIKNNVDSDVFRTYQKQALIRTLNIPVTDVVAVKINKAMDKCMTQVSGGYYGGRLLVEVKALQSQHKPTAKEQEQAIKNAELSCSNSFIMQATNAVGSKARALIYVLDQENYAIDPDFKKLAQKNDDDLSKIDISLN